MINYDRQEIAIKTIDKNVAVNAGAGTGKTKVLTERFVHILEHGNLEDGKEVESIVAITFTKKATQEMVDRIRKEIRKKISKGPKWKRYYRDMEKANISTIHSFCARILRENPIEAKVDPLFEVIEDFISTRLLKETIKEILSKKIEEDDDVYTVVKAFKKNSVDFLVNDFYQVYNKIRTIGTPLIEVKENTLEYLKSLKIEEENIEIIKDTLIYLMDKLPKNSKIYKLKDEPKWIEFRDRSYREEDLLGLLVFLYENIGSSTKEPEKIDLLKTNLEKALLSWEANNINIYRGILNLLIDIDYNYALKKEKIRGLDYDDLQIKVLELLENKMVREKYQDRFKYIMIDEFQDTNQLQKNIFYRLSTEKEKLDKSNLFVVGDPKQSIYGFRGADLDVFYDVIDDIRQVSKEETITLQKNYRTVDTVLAFINNIFSHLMLDRYTSLINFHEFNNSIDVEILEKEDLEVPVGYSPSDYYRYYEAQLIAKRIKELVKTGEFKYGDFAMLFRATTRNHIYEEALKRYDIPFSNSGGKQFFFQQEILDLINALKSISNPFDTIASIGLLRSPMIGLSDATLYWILKNRKSTLYNALISMEDKENIDEREKTKVREAIDLLSYFYSVKNIYGVSEILEKLLSKTYFIETLILKEGGKQSIANVYKFKDMIREYENKNTGTMEDLIDYLEEAKERDESQGKIKSENDDVVKILTIHKSKGLQFPVIIIPEMSTSSGGKNPNILFHKEIGIGAQLDSSKALYDYIKKELDKKEREERERVLYVAMTRAEKMIILGNQGKDSGFKKMIKDLINPMQCRFISHIDIEEEGYEPVRLIDEELINQNNKVSFELPLLYEIPEYNQKTIERYSISQYLKFIECNRSFFLDYYSKIYAPDEVKNVIEGDYSLGSMEKGNMVHKFCEHYRLGMDINTLLGKVCKSFGLSYDTSIYEELKPYINNYLKIYNEDFDKTYVEKGFYLKINNSYITGAIDRINIKDGKAEILDYKTNKVVNYKQLIEKYRPQIQLYAYVVKEIMNIEIHRARIVFLENGELADIPVDNKALQGNIEDIKNFIDFVSRNRSVSDYSKSKECMRYCRHKYFCELD